MIGNIPLKDHWAEKRLFLSRTIAATVVMLALAVLVAQFVPMKLTQRSTVVERSTAGATRVGAAAVRRAVTQRIRDLPGVVGAAPIKHGRRLVIKVEIGQPVQTGHTQTGCPVQTSQIIPIV